MRTLWVILGLFAGATALASDDYAYRCHFARGTEHLEKDICTCYRSTFDPYSGYCKGKGVIPFKVSVARELEGFVDFDLKELGFQLQSTLGASSVRIDSIKDDKSLGGMMYSALSSHRMKLEFSFEKNGGKVRAKCEGKEGSHGRRTMDFCVSDAELCTFFDENGSDITWDFATSRSITCAYVNYPEKKQVTEDSPSVISSHDAPEKQEPRSGGVSDGEDKDAESAQ